MNLEQVKSIVRDLLQIIGTLLVAYKVFGLTDTMWEPIAGGIMMAVPIVWAMFVHTQANAIVVVDAIGAVKQVELKPTREGIALAKTVASPTVVIAPHDRPR